MKALGEKVRATKSAAVVTSTPEDTTGTVYYVSPEGSNSNTQKALRDDRRGIHIVGAVTDQKKVLHGIYLHDLYILKRKAGIPTATSPSSTTIWTTMAVSWPPTRCT